MKISMTTAALMASLALAGCGSNAAVEQDGALGAMADRIAVEDMVVEYYAHLGGDNAGAFGDYFTEDAVFDVNGIIATGREEIEDLYGNMGEQDDNITNTGRFHMLLSNPVIEVDGDTATAQFVWTGVINSDIRAAPALAEQGREYDQLVKVDGKWLFTHRVVIADSGLPDMYVETYEPRADFSFDAGE